MKVLFILPYYNKIKKNAWSTGFGLYVIQLAEEIAKLPNVKVFVIGMKDHLQKTMVINNVTYIGIKDKNISFQFIKFDFWKTFFNLIYLNYYKQSILKKIIHAFYIAGKTQCIIKLLEKYKFDIIHIHSISAELYGLFHGMTLDRRKTVITLHGLVGNDNTCGHFKRYEYQLLNRLCKESYIITTVSSGIKKEIESWNGCKTYDNIYPILNGTTSSNICQIPTINIRDKYAIKKEQKILLCVGSLCDRKNQNHLIEAVRLMDNIEKDKFVILLIGYDKTEGEIGRKIKEYNLQKTIIECGFIQPEFLCAYYQNAYGNLLVSKNEAFGLSIIEGFMYGIPTLTFGDLPAINDLYESNSMIVLNSRNTLELKDGILSLIQKKWNKERIRQHFKKFQIDSIAKEYQNLYKNLKRDIEND